MTHLVITDTQRREALVLLDLEALVELLAGAKAGTITPPPPRKATP